MHITPVEKVIFICPECNIPISFEIPQENNDMNEFFESMSNLKCFRCSGDLSEISKAMIRKINDYNIATKELVTYASETNSALF